MGEPIKCSTNFFLQKRVLVHAAGEPPSKAAYVWGESLGQLLDNSTVRLNMSKPAKYIYTQNGELLRYITWISVMYFFDCK